MSWRTRFEARMDIFGSYAGSSECRTKCRSGRNAITENQTTCSHFKLSSAEQSPKNSIQAFHRSFFRSLPNALTSIIHKRPQSHELFTTTSANVHSPVNQDRRPLSLREVAQRRDPSNGKSWKQVDSS